MVILEVYNGTYCVYVHTNKINGKKYVGQTIYGDKPHKRWDNGNGYRNSSYFYKAIQKYGWDGFEHEVVANSLTAQEADNFEKILIKELDTTCQNKGYNIEPGGNRNKTMSDATKKKISESHIGDKNPMYGVSLSGEKNGMYGKHHTDETKMRISETISGEKNTHYGKPMSEETKQKISQSKKGKYTGDSNPFYGKHHTEETKNRISEANRGENATNAKMVIQMDDNYHIIKIWKYIADAYRTLGINRQSIQNVLHGKRQHAGGYRWFYLYDNVNRDGTVIMGAISLGYVTEEEIENAKNIVV